MADIAPSDENDYQAGATATFSREVWNVVMASIAARLKARELLEASFEALIHQGTQAALDMINVNVSPQLGALSAALAALEEELEDLIGGGVAPNALLLGGQNPSFYLDLANAAGTLPVAKVAGVQALIQAAIDGLVSGAPGTLDTLKELSDALGGDANFATNVAAALAAKFDKTGGVVTGVVEVAYSQPAVRLHSPGVYALLMWLTDDGYWRLRQSGAGDDRFRVGPGGDVWTAQFGDLNSRIEDRAAAWATAKGNEATNAANDRVHRIQLVGVGEADAQGRVYEHPVVVCDAWWNGITVVRRVRTLQMHIPSQGGWVNAWVG